MKAKLKITAVSLSLLTSAALIAGCSSSDSSEEVSNTPAPSVMDEPATSDSNEPTEDGAMDVDPGNSDGLSQMLPPVIVEENQTEVTVKVGDFLDIVVAEPEITKVEVDNTGILSITQGYSDGSAVFNPGAQALQPGVAVLIIQNESMPTREVTVTVTEN